MSKRVFLEPQNRWGFREVRHYTKDGSNLFINTCHSDGKISANFGDGCDPIDPDENFSTEENEQLSCHLEDLGDEDEYIDCEAFDADGNLADDVMDLVESYEADDDFPSLGLWLESLGWNYSNSDYTIESPFLIEVAS